MKITIIGLCLGLTLATIGCAQAIARHDLFERGDSRIGRAVESARRTCQDREPKDTLPSATEYEQCVLEMLRGAELAVARR